MSDIQVVRGVQLQEIAQPIHITLTKNTKGYQWEISIHSEYLGATIDSIGEADAEMRRKFGGETKIE